MATLVTGGTGCVCSNIVKTLAQRGHEVVCFDIIPADALMRKYVEPWEQRVTFVQGDIMNQRDLEQVAADHDITKIVHGATFTTVIGDLEEFENSRSIVDINLVGTANLLDLARGLSLQRFIYLSSAGVYGRSVGPDNPLREDDTPVVRGIYAITKYAGEQLTSRYGELYDFQTASCRVGPAYGPIERVTLYRPYTSVIHRWTGNVVRGEPIRVGDRSAGRDDTHQDDIAAAVCAVLDAPSLSHDLYNVSAGVYTTREEVIRVLTGLRPSLQVVDDPSSGSRGYSGVLDVTRLREDVGFTPRFDLSTGIRDYLQWREDFAYRD